MTAISSLEPWRTLVKRPGSRDPSIIALNGILRHDLSVALVADRLTKGPVFRCAAGICFALAAIAIEAWAVHSTPHLFALSLACFLVLSFGAIWLLYFLISRAAATKVVSLFYLTPPVTALIAGSFQRVISGNCASSGWHFVLLASSWSIGNTTNQNIYDGGSSMSDSANPYCSDACCRASSRRPRWTDGRVLDRNFNKAVWCACAAASGRAKNRMLRGRTSEWP